MTSVAATSSRRRQDATRPVRPARDGDADRGIAIRAVQALGGEQGGDPAASRASTSSGRAMSRPSAERCRRARCSASSVGRPARARSVSNTPSPSWNPRSNTDRCGPSAGQDSPSTQTCRWPGHPATSTPPMAPSGPRALATVSSHSAAGSLPQVMPPTDMQGQATTVGDERADEDARLHRAVRPDPAEGARVRAATDRLQALEQLHRPDLRGAGDGPARERGRRAGRTRPGRRPAGRSRSTRGAGPRPSAPAGTAAARGRVPGTQTRPRSLRRTSTIITFSARSLALASSSHASARSSARSRPRGRVPLIGSLATTPSWSTDRNGSGEALSRARGRPVSGDGPEVEERREQRRVAGAQASIAGPRVARERRSPGDG